MKSGKIFAFAIVALFCIGSLAVLAGPNASADEMELTEGSAYGQAFKMEMKNVEEAAGLSEGDILKFLNEALVAEIGSISTGPISIDSIEFQKLDFKIIIASLIEVVKANGDDGYIIDYAAGIGIEASVLLEIKGMLPEGGTYGTDVAPSEVDIKEKKVKFGVDVVLGLSVYGTMEFSPEGVLKSMTVNIELSASLKVKTGLTFEFVYGEDPADGPEAIKLIYKDTTYEASANLEFYAKLLFDPVVISSEDKYEVYVDDISASGKISFNKNLSSFIDMLAGESIVDTIMNNEFLDNGKFKLSEDMTKAAKESEPTVVDYFSLADLKTSAANLNSKLDDILPDIDLFDGLKPSELTNDQVKAVKKSLQEIKDIDDDGGNNTLALVIIAVVLVAVIAVIAVVFFIRKP